jgi:Eukaryotic elongation factor 5A hypusine, DNA-binding OB fold
MADDGETKDDVKVPEGEVGEKIDKLFTVEEKDTSKSFFVLALLVSDKDLTDQLFT